MSGFARSACGIVIACAMGFGLPAGAAPIAFPTQTTAVRLNGTPIGQPLHPSSLNSLRFTIAFNAADGLYHLWVLNGGDTQAPADMRVADITHATSADGRSFVAQGKLNPPADWWTQIPGVGATVEPSVNFLRADLLGGQWYLTIWSPNEAGTGRYNYNANVWNVGADANNLNIVQRGPLPSLTDTPVGPGGNMVGSFGMAGGAIYLRQDTQFNSGPPIAPPNGGGGMGRYAYTDGTRPSLSALWGTSEANLFAGTPYCWILPYGGPNPCTANPALKPSYVHNSGRVAPQGGTLGAYYTFRDATTAARQEQQIYVVESADNGATWSAPAGVYARGSGVLVDGLPNAANFSSPEIAGQRAYFSTADACGNLVVVTAEDPAQPRGPTIAKQFATTSLPDGGVTTLTVTLSVPGAACAPAPTGGVLTQVGFTDTLPAGLVLATPPAATNTCGGTLQATAGAGTFGLSGTTLTPGQTCAVSVSVRVTGAGTLRNTIARTGGSPANAGFFNAQFAAAVADADATVTVVVPVAAPIPALSDGLLALLAILLGFGAWFAARRR
ncbi:MAG: hypothetical protein U1F15_06550 [Burkholderiales bacterium]